MNSKRVDQTVESYLMEIDALREAAGARMVMGSGFPDEFASVLCMQAASFLRTEKSLSLVGVQGALFSPAVAKQMRR